MVMGRKPIVFNDTQLKEIMRFKPTLKDTAAFFECDPSTIENYIRANWNCTFSEFRDQNMVHTRFMLIRTAIQKAEKGDNVMLIFCLKNLCQWRDKLPDEQFDEDKFKSMSTQELIVFVKDKLQLEGQK